METLSQEVIAEFHDFFRECVNDKDPDKAERARNFLRKAEQKFGIYNWTFSQYSITILGLHKIRDWKQPKIEPGYFLLCLLTGFLPMWVTSSVLFIGIIVLLQNIFGEHSVPPVTLEIARDMSLVVSVIYAFAYAIRTYISDRRSARKTGTCLYFNNSVSRGTHEYPGVGTASAYSDAMGGDGGG